MHVHCSGRRDWGGYVANLFSTESKNLCVEKMAIFGFAIVNKVLMCKHLCLLQDAWDVFLNVVGEYAAKE